MDKQYITLFKELAQSMAASAETVMDYDREKNDDKGLETATIMRNDYQNLVERISADNYMLTRNDAAKLLVGAMVQINQIQDRINMLKKAMAGYQTDLLPVLQEIVDNTSTDEDAAKYAEEKFIIQEK